MKKKQNKHNKIIAFLKNVDFYIILATVILTMIYGWRIYGASHNGDLAPIISCIVFEIFFLAVYYLMKRKNIAIEKIFLFAIISMGSIFMFLMPPGQIPDEESHFKRAYSFTQGYFVAENRDEGAGNEMPNNINEHFYNDMRNEINFDRFSKENTFQTYTNTAVYNFVGYIPQSIAIGIARIADLPVIVTIYLAKIFNFATFVILIYYAIKIIPKFKSVILFVSLLPITLQEAISLSVDALTIGVSIFMVAYVLWLNYTKKKKMSTKEIVLLYVLACSIGFLKMIYLPLVLIYLTIPDERFGSRKMKVIHASIMGGLVLALNLSWMLISTSVPFHTMRLDVDIDAKQQALGVLRAPFTYLMIVLNSIDTYSVFWLLSLLGLSLGKFTINLPGIFLVISTIFAVLIIGGRSESLKIKKSDRVIYILTTLLVVGLLFTAEYLQWTEVGASIVDGIQGRYFIPIILLIPIMISRNINKKDGPLVVSEKTIISYSLFINIIAFMAILANSI